MIVDGPVASADQNTSTERIDKKIVIIKITSYGQVIKISLIELGPLLLILSKM